MSKRRLISRNFGFREKTVRGSISVISRKAMMAARTCPQQTGLAISRMEEMKGACGVSAHPVAYPILERAKVIPGRAGREPDSGRILERGLYAQLQLPRASHMNADPEAVRTSWQTLN